MLLCRSSASCSYALTCSCLPTCTANRERFHAVNGPSDFSDVQMTTYLKATEFRQRINNFKKAMGGGGGPLLGPQEEDAEPMVSGICTPCHQYCW